MGHAHGHAGHGHGHPHGPPPGAAQGRIAAALALIAAFMVVEVAAGILASSIALLTDAAHMATDAAALALALVAARLARRPARGQLTFGLGRAEVLSAQFNGATLLVLAGFVVYGAVGRLFDPPDVDGASVLVVGLLGAAVNVAATRILSGADRASLNVEGAYQHLLADLLGSLGAAAAGLVVLLTSFREADPIAALIVAAVMLRGAWRLLAASGRVFLEAAPAGLDVDELGRAMAAVPGVREVHDLHVWEVTSGFAALSAHVLAPAGEDCHAVRAEVERMLRERYDLGHTTLQVEHEHDPLLRIEPR